MTLPVSALRSHQPIERRWLREQTPSLRVDGDRVTDHPSNTITFTTRPIPAAVEQQLSLSTETLQLIETQP